MQIKEKVYPVRRIFVVATNTMTYILDDQYFCCYTAVMSYITNPLLATWSEVPRNDHQISVVSSSLPPWLSPVMPAGIPLPVLLA